jgi:hypothetical protein
MKAEMFVEQVDKNGLRYLEDTEGTYLFNANRVWEAQGKWGVPDMVTCCMVCARKTGKDPKKVQGVLIVDGGGWVAHPDDYDLFDPYGAIGWFAVGSECIKRVPLEYRVNLESGEALECQYKS